MLEGKRQIKPILGSIENAIDFNKRASKKANEQNCFPEVEKLRKEQKKNLTASYEHQKKLIRDLIINNNVDIRTNKQITIEELEELSAKLKKKENSLHKTKRRSIEQQQTINNFAATQHDAKLEQAYRAIQEMKAEDQIRLQQQNNKQLDLHNKQILQQLDQMKKEEKQKQLKLEMELTQKEKKLEEKEKRIEEKDKTIIEKDKIIESHSQIAQKAKEQQIYLEKENKEYQQKIKELEQLL